MIIDDVKRSVEIIRSHKKDFTPEFAAILGSGLSDVINDLDDKVTISYEDLSGFPVPKVTGHAGEFIAGNLNGKDVIFLKGRMHFYEGDASKYLKVMIRTLKSIGVKTLLLTNAAGSLNKEAVPGSLVEITDHINLLGINPLSGDNDNDWGVRFPSMDDAWNYDLRMKLRDCAKSENINLFNGVYAAMLGPNFETPAEINMLRIMGCDLVGMSTVPECIIARHCGINVIGVSVVTNLAAGMNDEPLSHEQTLRDAKKGAVNLEKLIKSFILRI